jgi:hypothetical protein
MTVFFVDLGTFMAVQLLGEESLYYQEEQHYSRSKSRIKRYISTNRSLGRVHLHDRESVSSVEI